LDDIDKRVSNPDLQVALLRKLLNDEIRSRSLANNMQAKIFSDQLAELLARYQNPGRAVAGGNVLRTATGP